MKVKHLVIMVVLATAVFGFGLSVQAIDNSALIAQLQEQIRALMQQITQLQSQQGTTRTWCHTFSANIGMGQKTGNPEIASLVIALQREGLLDQSASFDNGYDEELASAVTGFQEKYASEVLTAYNLKHGTGYVGKATRSKLNSLYGCEKIPFDCPAIQEILCGAGEKVVPGGFNEKGCRLPGKCVAVFCTQEAKQCPDGSYVSRIGPNCEFALCPRIYQCVTDNDCPQPTCSVPVGSYAPTCITTPIKCVEGKCVSTPVQVAEQVKCVFNGSQSEQKCYTATDNTSVYGGFGCSGKGACVVDIKGTKGESITWKSSCGGLIYTKMDGQSEYAQFECSSIQPAMKIISPNGGETYKFGDSITVKWETAGVSPLQKFDLIRLRAYPNGQEHNLVFGIVNDGQETIVIPASVPVGAYTLEIKTYINNVLVFDASDSYFKIVSGTTTCPNIQCLTDNCPGNHLPDANGCVNCSTPCSTACTDSDGGENVYVTGSSQAGDHGQFDYCDFTQNVNGVLNEAVCRDGQVSNATLNCPSDAPYCRYGKCTSIVIPVCTDTDGGSLLHTKGVVKETRMSEGPEYADYCENLSTFQPFSFDPSQNSCIGGTNCGLREYYCASPYRVTTFNDIACPNGCSNGACVQSTQASNN